MSKFIKIIEKAYWNINSETLDNIVTSFLLVMEFTLSHKSCNEKKTTTHKYSEIKTNFDFTDVFFFS